MSTRANFRRAAKKLERYGKRMERPFGSALRMIGEEVMTDVTASSPGRGVPRDTGALAASGRVAGPEEGPTVRLSYGDSAAPYALAQHERMDYQHDVGEPRYLVRGVDRWQPDGSAAMQALSLQADAVAARLGRE